MNNKIVNIKFVILAYCILASSSIFAIDLKDPDTNKAASSDLVGKMFQFEQRMNDRSVLKLQLLAHPEFKSERDLPSGSIKQAESLAKYLSNTHKKFSLKSVKLRTNGVLGAEWVSFYSCIDLDTGTTLEKPIAAIWVESKALGWYLSAMSL